jgi:hypothetical protein
MDEAREHLGQAPGVVVDQRGARALREEVLCNGASECARGARDHDMRRGVCIAHGSSPEWEREGANPFVGAEC